VETVGFPYERDTLFWNPRGRKSLDHIALDPPRHGADEALRQWRRGSGADFQDLRHQCRIVWNPVPHHDPASGPGHAYHLLGDIKRLGREHGAKDAHHPVKALILQLVQIRCIAFLKPAVRKALLPCTLVSRFDKVARDIDAQHVGSESRRWYCSRPIAASKSQNIEPFGHAESLDERLSTLSHGFRNAREIAFFPKRFVGIHLSNSLSLMASARRRSSAILDKKYNFFTCKWPYKSVAEKSRFFLIQGCKELAGTIALRGLFLGSGTPGGG